LRRSLRYSNSDTQTLFQFLSELYKRLLFKFEQLFLSEHFAFTCL